MAEGTIREILPDSVQGSFSPDGTQIAFWKDGEYWLAGPKGETAKLFITLDARHDFVGPKWSPDGRMLYLKRRIASGPIQGSIVANRFADKSATEVLSGTGLRDFWWTTDDRLIYSQEEGPKYYLWEVRIDKRASKASGQPRKLAEWDGYEPGFVSVSADGKRIVTTKGFSQSDVYVAELEGNGRDLKPERRLTLDQSSDWPTGWTRDNKEVLFFSDRNHGEVNIFRQGAFTQNPEQAIPGKEDARAPQISPDGQWLLYMVWPALNQPGPVRILRAPLSGSPAAELVLKATGAFKDGIMFSSNGSPDLKGTKMFPDFRCPTAPSMPCVLAEAEHDRVLFTAFDPMNGRIGEPTSVSASHRIFFWDLSPDGSRVAYGELKSADVDRIKILRLKDQTTQEVAVTETTNLSSLSWSHDGRDLFVTTHRIEGSDLLRVGLDGNAMTLLQGTGRWFANPRPSPDGRLLAFGVRTTDSNVVLIEIK